MDRINSRYSIIFVIIIYRDWNLGIEQKNRNNRGAINDYSNDVNKKEMITNYPK